MTSISKPIALTIAAFDENTAPKPVPPSLLDRLSTPPASPTKEKIEKRCANAKKLHAACVDAVKARATRDVQRAEDAKARKLRLAAANAEKIGRRAALADIKLSNLREAVAQKREEAKQKAEDRKAKFFDNRKAAGESKERRAQALQQACTDAADRRAKAIELTCEKSAAEYKHALSVAKEQKEKYEHDLIVASEKLELRLEAASSRRHAAMEAKMPTSPPGTTTKGGVRHRVFNEANVAAGLKRRSLLAAMEKAAMNRETQINEVKEKAQKQVEKARMVAEMRADAKAMAEKKAEWTRKMVNHEVARLEALKKRYGALGMGSSCPQLVLVGDFESVKAPPAMLLRRLAAKPTTLLATAGARQAGAAARRTLVAANRVAAAAKNAAMAASAASRRGYALSLIRDEIDAKAIRSLGTLAKRKAARVRLVTKAKARIAAAADRRATADAERVAYASRAAEKCAAATAKHAYVIRCRAKVGLVALQAAACANRRKAAADKKGERDAELTNRCTHAASKHSETLTKRVEVAKAATAKPVNVA